MPTIFFFAVAYGVIPYLTAEFLLRPAMGWFIGRTLIFMPLFIAAIALSRRDGFRSAAALAQRLRLRTMTARDWKYTIGSLVFIGALAGIIMAVAHNPTVHEIRTVRSFRAVDGW